MEYKTVTLLKSYLDALGINDYEITVSTDTLGLVIALAIPKTNNQRIAFLKGRNGRNLSTLKHLLRVVGPLEGITPFLIVKLDGESIYDVQVSGQ